LTNPWLQSPKIADDKLQDIFVHLPALYEEISQPVGVIEQRRSELTRRLDDLWKQLDDWRWEWEVENPEAARIVTAPGHDVSAISELPLAATLASRIDMDSVTNALDVYMYNATRVYVLGLRHLATHNRTRSFDERRLSTVDLDVLGQTLLDHQHSPLLLPGEAKLPCQYVIEAARMMPYLSEHLAHRLDPVTLMLAPTGIIVSALAAQPELEVWVRTLRSRVIYLTGPEGELSPFDIFT
jgi:hypothetical protein